MYSFLSFGKGAGRCLIATEANPSKTENRTRGRESREGTAEIIAASPYSDLPANTHPSIDQQLWYLVCMYSINKIKGRCIHISTTQAGMCM